MDPESENAPSGAPVLEPEKIIPLDVPLKAGDIEYREIKLQEPTGAQLAACDNKSGWAYTVALVSEVSGITPRLAGQLPARVLNECADYLTPFLRNVRPTGLNG